ncbi:MAG TPA: NAD(P)/FAD-dependent oxidoreductase [Allosphingosinicella sp.]|nr:NAD(P)/FAD-dependent oxidoreductase [Allosphingosinicella sp.]
MTNIAIIGAGCAGLGAATALMAQNGADVSVTLIEANDWIGGRARTSTDPSGLPVDLGPQFIQDPDDNPWARIAEKRGYEYAVPSVDTRYRMLDDGVWTTVDFNVEIDSMNSNLEKKFNVATGFSNAAVLTPEEGSLIQTQQGWALSLGSNGLGAIGESAEPWQYVASDRDRQVEPPYKPNWYVKNGLGAMVSAYGQWLLEQYAPKLKFFGGLKVIEIHQRKGEVSVYPAEGERTDFDFCIVTIPCSEVKKIKFDPALPGSRLRADDFIRLGSYKKVAFRPTKFPITKGNTIDEKCEYYLYDEIRHGVWQYFRLPTDPTVLICVTAGDFARGFDDWPDGDVTEMVIELLTGAYPDSNSDFRPANDEKVVTNWTKTPNIHGAYSYTWFNGELGPDNSVPLQARLEIALPHGRIHFAGEATWAEAYGTIHGAYNSGVRAAGEILAAIKQLKV